MAVVTMKKILIGIVVLLILAFFGVMFFAGAALRLGVEKGAAMALQVDTKVAGGTLNVLTGNVGLSGMKIGNPKGFKSGHAMALDDISISASVGSLMSDTIVIDRIAIKSPEITIDTDLQSTNLGKLMDNLDTFTGGGKKPEPKKDEPAAGGGKKLKIGEVTISGARLRVAESLGFGTSVALPLPDMVIRDIGGGDDEAEKKESVDLATLLRIIVGEFIKSAGKHAGDLPGNLGKLLEGESKHVVDAAAKVLEGAGGAARKAVDDVLKGASGLFK